MKGQWREIQITHINLIAKLQDFNVWKTVIKCELDWKRKGMFVGSNLFFFFFFFYFTKANGFYVWVCVIGLFPRIEPVGKPYREVCLQTEWWPWKVHQPNSWSKRPGTWIGHVLAYCRVGRKYVGCIELLFKLYRARFINRILGRNVQGHGLDMSWLIVALEESV